MLRQFYTGSLPLLLQPGSIAGSYGVRRNKKIVDFCLGSEAQRRVALPQRNLWLTQDPPKLFDPADWPWLAEGFTPAGEFPVDGLVLRLYERKTGLSGAKRPGGPIRK